MLVVDLLITIPKPLTHIEMDDIKLRIDAFLKSDGLKWFVAFRHPQEIWQNHRPFLMLEIVLYIMALLTFKHALRNGGRYIYLWFATILHGLVVESLSYFVPDIDNFWHAQSMVMFLGKRLPLHVIILYPCLIYVAVCAVSRMKLRAWAEPFAVGLSVVLLDIPFDIIGIKCLFWTWHDTDPNIFDRHYSVPWTSYYFHASFASSFWILFSGSRKLLCSTNNFESDGFFKEFLCTVVTGILAMPVGILQFIPLYHSLHDRLHIHSEVCVLLFLTAYILVVWTADRNPTKDARSSPNKGWFDELGLLVLLHFLFYIFLVLYEHPEDIRSIGLHEKTGNCSDISPVQTASGMVLTKKTYLCTSGFDEPYYDFHCTKTGKPPSDGKDWYTICGTPFMDHLEYIIVVSAFSLLGLYIYIQMLCFSGRSWKIQRPAKIRPKKD